MGNQKPQIEKSQRTNKVIAAAIMLGYEYGWLVSQKYPNVENAKDLTYEKTKELMIILKEDFSNQ